MIDPNPQRAASAARTFPPNAAGTLLLNNIVLSGDDAPLWHAAGYKVCPMNVQCSANLYAGDDALPDTETVLIAIDRNGAPMGRLLELLRDLPIGAPQYAQGVYDGASAPACVANISTHDIALLHELLSEGLPGFGCFAVMT